MLNDLARKGMRNDSLIVGLFIFLHVGSRLLAASFEIARNGSDTFQPAATTIALLWSDFSQESIIISEHIFWWIALGLILGFCHISFYKARSFIYGAIELYGED